MIYSADFPEGIRAAVEMRGFQAGPAASRKRMASGSTGRD